jgi:glycosyltransferase involved in cell wall biosynthesis
MTKSKAPTLSIIIPYYKDDEILLLRALYSIAIQACVNFKDIEVIICIDNGGNKNVAKIIKANNFAFTTKILTRDGEPNGPGQNRQNGVDHASGKYLTFLDADDTFHDQTTLATILNKIIETKSKFDFLRFQSLQESADGTFLAPTIVNNAIWLHGKVLKAEFLKDHEIRFSKDVTVNEDLYYNAVLNSYEPSIFSSDQQIYIWRHNKKSLTRIKSVEEFNRKLFYEYIKARRLALEDGQQTFRNHFQQILEVCVFCWLQINWEDWRKDNAEGVKKAEAEFKKFIKAHKDEFFANQAQLSGCFSVNYPVHKDKIQFRKSFLDWIDEMLAE